MDAYRDERGRLKPGHAGLFKGKRQDQPTQSDAPQDQDTPSPDFDAAIIAAAHSYGSGSRSRATGIAGYCANLRDTRPVEFAALLSKALARKAEADANPAAFIPITVVFDTAPSGMYIDENGKLVEMADARAEWARRTGHTFEPAEPPPSRPVLVQPRDDEDEPPHAEAKPPSKPYALMSGAELAAALATNEITFSDADPDE